MFDGLVIRRCWLMEKEKGRQKILYGLFDYLGLVTLVSEIIVIGTKKRDQIQVKNDNNIKLIQ